MTSESHFDALGITNAIDSHIHPWLLSNLPPVIRGAREVRPDLAQDYSPSKIVSTAAASGFSGVILVQACDPGEGNLAEAKFFIEAAKRHTEIVGCVVGIDLLDPAGTEELIQQIDGNRVVRSCRMIAPENSGVGILSDPRAKTTAKLLGQQDLRLDLLIRSANPGQLKEGLGLVQWLAENSSTVVIGDHLLKPTGVTEGIPRFEWIDTLKALADCPNFYLKISGLPGEVPKGSDTRCFWPFYDLALETFSAERLLFGSDHPVSFSHHESVACVTNWLLARGLSESGNPQEIFSNSARRAYGLTNN